MHLHFPDDMASSVVFGQCQLIPLRVYGSIVVPWTQATLLVRRRPNRRCRRRDGSFVQCCLISGVLPARSLDFAPFWKGRDRF